MRITRTPLRKRIFLALATSCPSSASLPPSASHPDTATENLARETVVEALAPPAVESVDSGVFDFWREERIGRGETLPGLLQRLGVSPDERQTFPCRSSRQRCHRRPDTGPQRAGKGQFRRQSVAAALSLLRHDAGQRQSSAGQFRSQRTDHPAGNAASDAFRFHPGFAVRCNRCRRRTGPDCLGNGRRLFRRTSTSTRICAVATTSPWFMRPFMLTGV
jgi:hypothetical protein